MLKCPKCGGYGKAVSTRNSDNGVIRYHKCDKCGDTFTSTQKVNHRVITKENIDDILRSDKFEMLIYPLFQAFDLNGSFYNNTYMVSEYDFNKYVLSSIEFDDNRKKVPCRFDIHLMVADEKFNGIIKLVKVPNNDRTDVEVVANIGTINNLDGHAHINLDIPTINKLIQSVLMKELFASIV